MRVPTDRASSEHRNEVRPSPNLQLENRLVGMHGPHRGPPENPQTQLRDILPRFHSDSSDRLKPATAQHRRRVYRLHPVQLVTAGAGMYDVGPAPAAPTTGHLCLRRCNISHTIHVRHALKKSEEISLPDLPAQLLLLPSGNGKCHAILLSLYQFYAEKPPIVQPEALISP